MNAPTQTPSDISACLRLALRSLVRPVAVVTAEHDGERYAMAATAFCEVSMDPPSMLVCVNRTNSTYKAIAGGADIGLNLLSEDQVDISNNCASATTSAGKFAAGSWIHAEGKPPRLADGLAAMVLRPRQVVDQGTHTVVIGEVIDIDCWRNRAPLAFHEGGYMFPLATALLNMAIQPGDAGGDVTRAHDFLIMRLMAAFYWFDEGMQSALQHMGWERISRSESMVFANMAMGIQRPTDIARNLGLPADGLNAILAEMQQKELITCEDDPKNPDSQLVRYNAKSNRLRQDAMQVLAHLEDTVGDRIGKRALQTLRATLSRDWGNIPELKPETVD